MFKYLERKSCFLMEDIWTCPNCGATMKKIMDENGIYRTCPKCGCTVEGHEQHFDENQVCPNCHQEMESNCECSYCGYDLGTDFE